MTQTLPRWRDGQVSNAAMQDLARERHECIRSLHAAATELPQCGPEQAFEDVLYQFLITKANMSQSLPTGWMFTLPHRSVGGSHDEHDRPCSLHHHFYNQAKQVIPTPEATG